MQINDLVKIISTNELGVLVEIVKDHELRIREIEKK